MENPPKPKCSVAQRIVSNSVARHNPGQHLAQNRTPKRKQDPKKRTHHDAGHPTMLARRILLPDQPRHQERNGPSERKIPQVGSCIDMLPISPHRLLNFRHRHFVSLRNLLIQLGLAPSNRIGPAGVISKMNVPISNRHVFRKFRISAHLPRSRRLAGSHPGPIAIRILSIPAHASTTGKDQERHNNSRGPLQVLHAHSELE